MAELRAGATGEPIGNRSRPNNAKERIAQIVSCLRRNWNVPVCALASRPRGGFSSSRTRKNYTPREKVAILKRHLLDKVPGCDLCDELGLNPTVFYG